MGDPRYNNISSASQISIPKALELVRNSETGEVHPTVDATLERAIVSLWQRIRSRPDTYVMTKDEFAVFNYFRGRYTDQIAQRAVQRFWNSFKGDPPSTDKHD